MSDKRTNELKPPSAEAGGPREIGDLLEESRLLLGVGEIVVDEIREDVVLLYFNQSNEVKGVYRLPCKDLDDHKLADLVEATFTDYVGRAIPTGREVLNLSCRVVGGEYDEFTKVADVYVHKRHRYADGILRGVAVLVMGHNRCKKVGDVGREGGGNRLRVYRFELKDDGSYEITWPTNDSNPADDGAAVMTHAEYLAEGGYVTRKDRGTGND
ncbi:hypothetical protein ACFL0V_04050 [Nanoarchaeota archaeon]